jgi:hypothetical protein
MQAGLPFGASIGGVNPMLAPYDPTGLAPFDSWLTVAAPGPDGQPAYVPAGLSQIGLEAGLGQWSETSPLTTENGAIFFTDPGFGPTGESWDS